MKNFEEIIGGLVIVAGAVTIVYLLAKYTYLIKKVQAEHGETPAKGTSKYKYLDIGCIVLALGLGVLTSSLYTLMELSEDTTDLLAWGTILIFGGLGLLAAHYVRTKLEK